ncbi:MAG TPA: methionyl-tRNA formyltransferase [Candidatus Kerfeldbacteria bacterium]|nr:methionyl-tRNA formyltransferase [Candidatus Kerfeldbacteria bacterium]
MEKRKYKVLFAGTPDFAVPILSALVRIQSIDVVGVLTQPDKPAGRGYHLIESPIKRLARRYKLPIYQPLTVTDPSSIELLSGLSLDVVVLAAYGELIPKKLLSLPRCGWLNVHASLLPRLRGASPIQHALLEGYTETGITLMKMVEKLDAGPVIAKSVILVDKDDTAGSLHDKLALLGAKCIEEYLIAYLTDWRPITEQDHEQATYCKKIRSSDARIDWHASADEINRLVRAMNPAPGAFTQFDGNQVKIFAIETFQHEVIGPPGTVGGVGAHLVVSSGTRPLHILSLQLPGKKKVTGAEFINGHRNILPFSFV